MKSKEQIEKFIETVEDYIKNRDYNFNIENWEELR